MDIDKKLLNIVDAYDYIIFDFDGTLANINIHRNDLKKELSQFVQDNYWIKKTFTPLDQCLIECKHQYGDKIIQELFSIIEYYEKNAQLSVIENWLRKYICENIKKKFWLFTMNMTSTVYRFLKENHNSVNPFSHIITKETCIEFKPSWKDLLYFIALRNIDPLDVLYIWDSENDKKSWDIAWIKTFIL